MDEEFADGDIEKMKAHCNEVKKTLKGESVQTHHTQEEINLFQEKKAKDLEGVEWTVIEKTVWDSNNDSEILLYCHTLTLNDQTFKFTEECSFGIGTLIRPYYYVADGAVIHCYKNNTHIWQAFDNRKGWYDVRELIEDELKAYLIVERYGKYSEIDNVS